MENVVRLNVEEEATLEEWLAQRGVQDEVVRVERSHGVALAAVHGSIGAEGRLDARQGVLQVKAVFVVEDIELLEVAHPALRTAPGKVTAEACLKSAKGVVQTQVVALCPGVDHVAATVGFACEHGVVYGVVVLYACPDMEFQSFDQATVFVVQRTARFVTATHVFRLVGVDTRLRVVKRRLRHVAVVVVELCLYVKLVAVVIGVVEAQLIKAVGVSLEL